MMNLLELFSTDRKLLEARGSLIIRQLCLNLNTERIYKTFAEILEKEEVGLVLTCATLADGISTRIWSLQVRSCRS
jgi:hypothetical protein